MKVVGLTGGIGSGKTTIANLFAKRGVPIIDADVIARKLTLPGQHLFTKIVEHFTEKILLKDGNLNRAELRDIIFRRPDEKKWLESLLHPAIENEIKFQIMQLTTAYCLVVIPLLIEVGCYTLVDRILVVDTSVQSQIKRVTQRDHLTPAQAAAIIHTQIERGIRLAKAHEVIHNDGTLKELDKQVEKLHNYYLGVT